MRVYRESPNSITVAFLFQINTMLQQVFSCFPPGGCVSTNNSIHQTSEPKSAALRMFSSGVRKCLSRCEQIDVKKLVAPAVVASLLAVAAGVATKATEDVGGLAQSAQSSQTAVSAEFNLKVLKKAYNAVLTVDKSSSDTDRSVAGLMQYCLELNFAAKKYSNDFHPVIQKYRDKNPTGAISEDAQSRFSNNLNQGVNHCLQKLDSIVDLADQGVIVFKNKKELTQLTDFVRKNPVEAANLEAQRQYPYTQEFGYRNSQNAVVREFGVTVLRNSKGSDANGVPFFVKNNVTHLSHRIENSDVSRHSNVMSFVNDIKTQADHNNHYFRNTGGG